MKACLLFVLIVFTSTAFSQNVSPQFSELKGMEDQSGKTHLFYRIYTSSYDSVSYWQISSDNIYHFDLLTQEDTLFLESYMRFDTIYYYPEDFVIADLNFWQDNPSYYIYGGATQITILNEQTFIQRFDSENTYDKGGVVKKIEISKQNDSLLYAGVNVYDAFLELTIKSTDGGWNWESISDTYEMLSLNPSNDQTFFAWEIIYANIYKTTDGGGTFYIVDSSMTYQEQQYHYDPDETHIYRVVRNFITNNYVLKVSSNGGEAFSWVSKFISPDQIFISNNQSISGEIYLVDGNSIYISTDYGDNFNLYKTLDKNIVGIYKKPNSNKLYAATKYKIYEITPDSIHIIKSLPIADEVLNFYPLAIGNKWVYDTYGWWADTTYHSYSGITFREVVGDTVMSNGKLYYKLFDPTTFNYPPILFERIDSSSGKVFRYDHTLGLQNDEYLIDDLLAEVGDTVWSNRHQYQDYFPFICVDEGVFNKWGIQGLRKIFTIYDLTGYTYSLSQGVGIDSIYDTFDFGENYVTLKGCIIDGVVYGDTLTVSVDDENQVQPTEFSLSQNYPNPFNPSTKIKFTILQSPLPGGDGRGGLVTLKVYDVLGNEIVTLVNEELPAGSYELKWNATNFPSGIYFYQLRAGSFVQTKKMILLR